MTALFCEACDFKSTRVQMSPAWLPAEVWPRLYSSVIRVERQWLLVFHLCLVKKYRAGFRLTVVASWWLPAPRVVLKRNMQKKLVFETGSFLGVVVHALMLSNDVRQSEWVTVSAQPWWQVEQPIVPGSARCSAQVFSWLGGFCPLSSPDVLYFQWICQDITLVCVWRGICNMKTH